MKLFDTLDKIEVEEVIVVKIFLNGDDHVVLY